MTNEKAIMCLEDMRIKVPIPKAAKQARENNEALDVAIKALQNEPHWIPVTEEPIPDGEYLVTWTSEIQEKPILSIICRYSGVWDCWELQMLGHHDINVLAYMELPEAYKPTVPPECEGDCGWCKPTVIEKCKGVTT